MKNYGEPHAERNALASCSQSPEGATIYVTLEPCCHHGKQPPCTDAIIEAGISRVVTGSGDPNPLVGGKRNPDFKGSWNTGNRTCVEGRMRRIKSGIFPLHPDWPPYVTMKYAMTMDGNDRRLYRCFQMGDRGRSQASCT